MKSNTNEFWVGLFAGLGFLILTFVIFFVGGISIFKQGYFVTLKFDYVSILDKGAPIRMAGVRVGEVKNVTLKFDEEQKKNRVFVKIFLNEGTEVRENYTFSVQGTFVLSEPHIEITPIPGELPFVKSGSYLEGIGPIPVDELLSRSMRIAGQMEAILASVQQMTDDKEVTDALKVMVINFADLSVQMKAFMEGNQDDMSTALKNIRSFSESLESAGKNFDDMMKHVKQGEGNVGKMVYSDEIYKDMRELVADIKKHPWKLLKKDKKFFFF